METPSATTQRSSQRKTRAPLTFEDSDYRDTRRWLLKTAREKHSLYEKYGKPLEKDHMNEYAAISYGGQTILGKRLGEVMLQAKKTFATNNNKRYSLFRVGHRTLAQWRRIT